MVASGSTQQRGIRANDRLGDEQRRAQLKSSVPQADNVDPWRIVSDSVRWQ